MNFSVHKHRWDWNADALWHPGDQYYQIGESLKSVLKTVDELGVQHEEQFSVLYLDDQECIKYKFSIRDARRILKLYQL
jgi:hypothetical protein